MCLVWPLSLRALNKVDAAERFVRYSHELLVRYWPGALETKNETDRVRLRHARHQHTKDQRGHAQPRLHRLKQVQLVEFPGKKRVIQKNLGLLLLSTHCRDFSGPDWLDCRRILLHQKAINRYPTGCLPLTDYDFYELHLHVQHDLPWKENQLQVTKRPQPILHHLVLDLQTVQHQHSGLLRSDLRTCRHKHQWKVLLDVHSDYWSCGYQSRVGVSE